MRVHLTHDEGVDVEELAHPVHGKIASHTPVNEFEVTFELRHVVWLEVTLFSLDHELNAIIEPRNCTARYHR